MKKNIIYFVFALLSVTFTYAQEFSVGTNVINAGIGLGGYYGGYSTSSQSPVLSVSYERGVWDVPGPGVVSLGGYFGRKTFKYNSIGSDYSWSYNVIGVRGAYHYLGLEVENLDVYAGAMASYRIYSGDRANNFGSSPGGTAFIGGRYYFAENFAVFAEGGYGVALLSVGASFRF
ncbi:hypothetical protein JQC67_17335 [Aurantibacter crassamenti]|uniref:hypothetical protein n=1 Tax=Aurantibacter crassamenti TaxID=1837375 RepID=UPI00193AD44F|nr:hypothetical protein [Aurantibacter crassamenti]MBM1107922.1 hypothetical protein [Aurantibacter crassamenti]